MAISIHIVDVQGEAADSAGYVVADETYPNSNGNPDVADYLIAEANDGFVATYIGFDRIITYSAADINNAS